MTTFEDFYRQYRQPLKHDYAIDDALKTVFWMVWTNGYQAGRTDGMNEGYHLAIRDKKFLDSM